jgi:AcrR family transcriptional regulator
VTVEATPRVETAVGGRERLLEAAYELFSRYGVRGVGIDEVIARAGVAKATMYRHFRSKDDLVVAFLELREQRWSYGWVEAEARRRGDTPEEQLLAIFDAFDEWFRGKDYEGCSFVNVLFEMGAGHPGGEASIHHLDHIRAIVRGLAEDADLREPEEFARSWHILMKGAIVMAAAGDREAARRAQEMARLLIAEYRRGSAG